MMYQDGRIGHHQVSDIQVIPVKEQNNKTVDEQESQQTDLRDTVNSLRSKWLDEQEQRKKYEEEARQHQVTINNLTQKAKNALDTVQERNHEIEHLNQKVYQLRQELEETNGVHTETLASIEKQLGEKISDCRKIENKSRVNDARNERHVQDLKKEIKQLNKLHQGVRNDLMEKNEQLTTQNQALREEKRIQQEKKRKARQERDDADEEMARQRRGKEKLHREITELEQRFRELEQKFRNLQQENVTLRMQVDRTKPCLECTLVLPSSLERADRAITDHLHQLRDELARNGDKVSVLIKEDGQITAQDGLLILVSTENITNINGHVEQLNPEVPFVVITVHQGEVTSPLPCPAKNHPLCLVALHAVPEDRNDGNTQEEDRTDGNTRLCHVSGGRGQSIGPALRSVIVKHQMDGREHRDDGGVQRDSRVQRDGRNARGVQRFCGVQRDGRNARGVQRDGRVPRDGRDARGVQRDGGVQGNDCDARGVQRDWGIQGNSRVNWGEQRDWGVRWEGHGDWGVQGNGRMQRDGGDWGEHGYGGVQGVGRCDWGAQRDGWVQGQGGDKGRDSSVYRWLRQEGCPEFLAKNWIVIMGLSLLTFLLVRLF